jgi:lysozyme
MTVDQNFKNLSVTDKAKALLKIHEGFEEKVYFCPANKLTIGYGRNLQDRGINEEEADYLLNNDVNLAINELESIIPNFHKIDSNRQSALIDMIVNLGRPKFLKFKNTIKAIKNENWELASKEMLNSKWARQVPNRAMLLSNIVRYGKGFNDE